MQNKIVQSDVLVSKNIYDSKYKLLVLYAEFVFIIILSLLAGYNIIYETTDSVIYKAHYESITWENYLGDEIYFELLYKLFASFSALFLNIEYELYASLLAFLALSIKFYLFSRRPYALYLALAYLITLYPFYESLRMRAGLAIALVFLAIELRNHKIWSLVLLCLGVGLHYSLAPFVAVWLLYYYLSDIKNTKRLLYLFVIGGIVAFIMFRYLEFMLDYLDFRVLAYIIEDAGYFNIWSIPKHFLIGILSYLMINHILEQDQKIYKKTVVLLFISTAFWILSLLTIKINMLSVGLLDIGIFGYFLTVTQANFKNKALIRFVFFLIIILDILFKIFELPVLIIKILN